MFDPNYAPESVDFVIAHQWVQTSFINAIKSSLSIVSWKLEMTINPIFLDEKVLFDYPDHPSSKVEETMSRDSVVVLHADMAYFNPRGIRSAQMLSHKTDARFLVGLDMRCLELTDYSHVRKLLGKDYPVQTPSPRNQVSFFPGQEIVTLLSMEKGCLFEYLKELAGARNP